MRMQSREYKECENAESECRLRECRVESTDSRVKGRARKECENAESRVQSAESRVQSAEYNECNGTESRVQTVRESKVESRKIVSAESVCTVREHSGESARAQT